MAYNMTTYTDSVNILGLYVALNEASNYLLSYLMIIGVFIVVLFTLLRKDNPPAESFTAASIVVTVFSLFFLLADIINITWVIGSVIITAISVIKLYFQ